MKYLIFTLTLCWSYAGYCQDAKLSGVVNGPEGVLPFANVRMLDSDKGVVADEKGAFILEELSPGSYLVEFSFVGYKPVTKRLVVEGGNQNVEIEVMLLEQSGVLDQVVVTGTRTAKKITDSPVIVDVINSELLVNTQSVSLSEGLRFQPGLRVETDCQTCNYTQLRMNGLQGGYSQILINSRPIFSPLTGLYGLEQIPTNMIERIEVVRGGGSALYGTGAVGGTVNVITKIPKEASYDLGYTLQSMDGALDHVVSGNATTVNESKNAGVTLFLNSRRREWYDLNGDNFSEIPEIRNNSLGANFFLLPAENQKIDVNFSSINEYRYGGEMVDLPAHLTEQSEERDQNVLVGNIDYQVNFNEGRNSLITYFGYQNTTRTHYTGVLPDEPIQLAAHLAAPPYGTSDNTTFQAGAQLDQKLDRFLMGSNVITLGAEYTADDIIDEIPSYQFLIDQVTRNFGVFVQSDWAIGGHWNFLSGVRLDKHNLVDQVIASPRFSLLYNFGNFQWRGTWGAGFRAPQAFDADLHIAFAGGGISRVRLSPDLDRERSNSLSTSINYDKLLRRWVYGFTAEVFYTHLQDAFFLAPQGEDEFGEVFEKQNGQGATVQGVTLEFRANYNEQLQLDIGLTVQRSTFQEAVLNSDILESRREFLRTPNEYGYGTLSYSPDDRWTFASNYAFTGSMLLVHFAGAPEQTEDAYFTSPSFSEVGLRGSYQLPMKKLGQVLEISGGVKNLTNAYQGNFDTGKNRDSNFVYGPSIPRTFFIGLRIKSK